jgi:amino acid adenylation domain-containing protein
MQQEIVTGFRLSPQQERLWLLQQNSPAYRAQCAILLEGYLNTEALREAIHRVIKRHEILRTTFHSLPGMKIPVQVIAEAVTPSWRNLDLRDCSSQEQEAKIEELFQEERHHPFDFERGPLLRLLLLTLSADKHLLLLSSPALCADAWTLKNLVHEIGRSYGTGSKDEEQSDEALQYTQFSEWQNGLLEDEDAEAGKDYWRRQNFSASPSLKLSFESKRVGETGFEPDALALVIGREVVAKIDAIAEKYHTSAAAVLLSCWQMLLWRLTGQADIIVGDACDGRQHEVLQSALGLIAKWLPIHCRFERNLQFSEVLFQIDVSRRNAYEWQEYFVWDGSTGAAENSMGIPFFPICFEFEERPLPYRANGVLFSVYKQFSCVERFNIKLSCRQVGDSLAAEFHYNPEKFQSEDIKRLARQFDALLQSVSEEADVSVSELEILSEIDRHQLLVAFNNTDTGYPRDKCIHQLFEEQVERTPDNLAVVFGDQQLSYAELNARANQLAHHLQKLEVGPEVVVGLCLERSLEMVVGILGILKAGGAYVPLEPAYPKERLAFILVETRAAVILTQERLKEHLPEHKAGSLCLDADWKIIAQESEENPVNRARAENLAYVIYTSGSMGKPKGVMIQHGSAVNLATGLGQAIYAHHGAPLRVSLNAPLTFDASVKQLLQLLQGHTLCILPEEVRLEGNELLSYMRHHALEVLDCTPAQLRLLLAAGPDLAPKLVLVGGEAVDEITWAFLAESTRASFYNVYGPTECTVDATTCCLQAGPSEPAIGRPIANTQIYLLDDRLEPVPLGIPGELYIGGAGLARGYLSRAELTAEKFIPNPFSDKPGARLYKTGDLACYLSDGNIKFLGRIDHQVKLRGFRIELGEIEAVLGQHPAVRDNAVVVREDAPGDLRLVAYLVSKQEPAPAVSELRSFLREKLPEYMVPSAFVMLDELPLTRHGKVDRRALPVPESQRPELQAAYVAPRTKIERTIATVWQEVLRVEKVGTDDNFFDLGGHSLLMVQVHSKLREVFNKEISLIEMFRNPTVGSLAKYFSEEQSQQPSLQRAHDRAQKRKNARSRQTGVMQARREV